MSKHDEVFLGEKEKQAAATALAKVLVNAMDSGEEGAEETGGYGPLFQNGPRPYAAGVKAGGIATGTPGGVYAHGPGGIFSTAGIENVVVNAHMVPEDLDGHLPVYPTQYMNPVFPSLTGWSEEEGDEPDGRCESCLGGTIQGCEMTAQFGHLCRGSDEIHITRTNQMINRGETTPLTLLGEVLGPGSISRMPNTPRGWLEVVTRAEMVKIAILLQRKIMRMTWNGNPANNTANGGYREFPGLETFQVGTGKMDITGVACPALDSLVMNFGCTDLAGLAGVWDLVQTVSTMEWWIRRNANRMKLMPVQWVFAMRPDLWFLLSAIWACRYMSDRCTTASGNEAIVINDDASVKLRDAMRQGMYLIVNGRKYPVIECDGITEEHGDPGRDGYNDCLVSGEYLSSIFFLPLSARNMKTLYWEHLDYTKSASEIAMSRSQNDFWTDGGRYLWTMDRIRGCYTMAAEMDLRIILRTPHIAGRIDEIKYSPQLHSRSPFYGDPYFIKGGVHERANPALNWNTEWGNVS